jgi:hypothetical protein
MPSYFSILILLVLAWGAFAFGGVYKWAYTPLFWAADRGLRDARRHEGPDTETMTPGLAWTGTMTPSKCSHR